jgi:hypothetical protein
VDANALLNQVTIGTPCSVRWDTMPGDAWVRFCDSCHKRVYNVAELTAEEAIALIRDHGGVLCAQLYRRPDGTLVTADCAPESTPSVPAKRWQFRIQTLMAVVAGCAALFGLTRLFAVEKSVTSSPNSGAGVPLGDIAMPPRVMQAIQNLPNCSIEAGGSEVP